MVELGGVVIKSIFNIFDNIGLVATLLLLITTILTAILSIFDGNSDD